MAPRLIAEAVGTFVLVLFGTGAVASAVLTSALQGVWQVASIWALGVAAGIVIAGPASGAHLNPAVTLAFALRPRDRFPGYLVFPYWLSQLLGAVVAGLVTLLVFGPYLQAYEASEGIVRGAPGSERSALILNQYFPHPLLASAAVSLSLWHAATVEALGTAILVLVIFAVTDRDRALTRPAAALWIGLTVGALICVFAPLTQAGWNPARDLGPRIVAYLAGWGAIALPGPQAGFWIYIVGPLLGGVAGGWLYESRLFPRFQRGAAEPLSRPGRAVDSGDRMQHSRSSTMKRILFLCTHNSARSQMAEGLLRQLGGSRFEAASAGTEATFVRPLAIRAMAEIGIDISRQESKTIERFLAQPFDLVITLCDEADAACPVFPHARKRAHWPFPDPAKAEGSEEARLQAYRAVRDAIRERIERELLASS